MYFERRASKKAKKGFTWCVKFYYEDLYGCKRRYSKSGFETKAEAQAHGLQMKEELKQTGGRKPEAKTLEDVYREWEAINGEKLAPGTLRHYKGMMKKIPFMGRPIRSVAYPEIQEFFNSQKDYSRGRNKIIHSLLSNLFKLARKSGYILHNPMPDVEVLGKEKAPQKDALSLSDIEAMCTAIDMTDSRRHTKKNLKMFLYIGFYTGLRRSEILALEVSDVDLERRTLSASKKVEFQDGPAYVTERMKTKASRSLLPICEPLAELLADYCKGMAPGDLLISGTRGQSYPRNFLAEKLAEAAQTAGIEGFHPHLLRHSFITNLVREGADPKTAAQLARHSSINTTLNIYTQMSQNDLSAAVNRTFPKRPKKDPEAPEIFA